MYILKVRQLSTSNYTIKSNEKFLKFVSKPGNSTHIGPLYVDVLEQINAPKVLLSPFSSNFIYSNFVIFFSLTFQFLLITTLNFCAEP